MVKADDPSFAFKLAALPTWMRPLFDPAWGKATTRRRLILGGMATAWFVIVLATIWHHEFWRDEVVPLSIAIASRSLWEIPDLLKNVGHPVVWYVLLRIGHQALGSSLALPTVSLLVAGAAVMIFLFRSPFSLGLKLLFVFSVLPLYEYSVMARNYGISMLLMFGFAAIYPHRRRHPFVVAVLLALLANTNVHSLLIAGILTLLWLWDDAVVDRRVLTARQLGLLGFAAGLILTSALFGLKTALPDERTVATSALQATNLGDFLRPFAALLRRPWETMEALIPFPNPWPWRFLQILLMGGLLLGLAVRTRLALALLAAFLALGFLFKFAYPGVLRHQGILLVFTLVLYWLNAEAGPSIRGSFPARFHSLPARFNSLALLVVFPLVLFWNDCLAFYKIQEDFKMLCSSSKPLGEWLNSHPEYRDSIILGEPDYLLESLPYYAAQRIYIPRESRFGNWVRFTTDSRPILSLGELLDAAQGLKEKEHQTVFVTMGFPASVFEQKRSVAYSYNKVLTWTPSQWQRFRQSTKRVAEFWSSKGDENFDLYEIR